MVQFIQLTPPHQQSIHDELIAGLLAPQAHTSPKYLYDALGSKLFEAICELPEYYPTRTEAEIFDTYAYEIAESVGDAATLIDLGAGNCVKAARLFPTLHPAQYVALDISVDFLREAVGRLQQQFPHIEMTGIGCDFSSTLELSGVVRRRNRLFFYPGSSIGNFDRAEALALLKRIAAACRLDGRADGGLLIGVDLAKHEALLNAAYDDALGVTAAFNLNLLLHLNRILEADFVVNDWRHHGFFNPALRRVEMHLEARRDLTVNWRGGQRQFTRGQRIHTENSYKYQPEEFIALLAEAGFDDAHTWTDAQGWFMVCHARAS